MIYYLLLFAIVILLASQCCISKLFCNAARKNEYSVYLYNVFNTFTAMCFFIVKAFITNGKLEWHLPTFLMSAFFAGTFALASLFFNMAVSKGPLSLSSLFLSYSLLIPTLYGIVILKENVSIPMIIGFVFLIVSIFLVNYEKSVAKVNIKWLICAIITFLANGFCTVSEKVHQNSFPGEYTSEFLAYGMMFVFLFFLVSFIIVRIKTGEKQLLKPSAIFGCANGLCNATTNMLSLILASKLAAALMFPVMSAGQIVFTVLASIIIFKEALTKKQYAGVACGVFAIVLLNL